MKKLLLTSSFATTFGELSKILTDYPSNMTVAFVPTAADDSEDPWYVRADRAKLVEMGFKVLDLNLKDKTQEEVNSILQQSDVIFVAGGNTFYLLDQANKSGFSKLVPDFVNKGVIYVGSSAGSYIACPTIEAAGLTNSDKNTIGLQDLTAMNLVPYILKAHYVPEKAERLRDEIAQCNYPVKILTDQQALLAIGDKCIIVGKGEEIAL